MSKAKTASKNNPNARASAKKFFHNNKEIKPVKIVTQNSSFFGAVYKDTGELVVCHQGKPLPWQKARL